MNPCYEFRKQHELTVYVLQIEVVVFCRHDSNEGRLGFVLIVIVLAPVKRCFF